MLRVFAYLYCCGLLVLAGIVTSAAPPAAGDTPPTFAPAITPAPTTTPIATALAPPITRPEDAHGITQTTSPLRSPAAYSPPPLPPALWPSTANSFTIPCAVHAQRVFVPVVANGIPETFILDSAAPSSEIDPAVAPQRDVPFRFDTLQVGELRFNFISAAIGKISAYASTYLGASAQGVLGRELFSRYPVRIDYRGCTVTVFRDSTTAQAAMAKSAAAIALRLTDGIPAVESKLDGVSALLAVDTVSNAEVDVTRAFADANRLSSLVTRIPELRRALPTGDLSGETARARTLSVGQVVIERPLVGIIESSIPSKSRTAGSIGAALLDQFVVLIDEPGAMLVLESPAEAPQGSASQSSTSQSPTAQTPAPPAAIAYDRAGAWLIMRFNAIYVKSVLPGSPAAAARLQRGDLIVRINGQPVHDLDAAGSLFAGPPGVTLSVTYQRSGVQHATALTLKTLI